MKENLKHNGYLDFLKFLFALGIIGVHSNACGFSFRLISSGYLGVEFFFLVSGYFVTREAIKTRSVSSSPQNITNHFIKRLLNFFPFYLIPFIYSFVVHNIVHQVSDFTVVLWNLYNSLFDIIPLQIENFPSLCVTGVQWYISALFIVSPLLYALIFKYGNTFTMVFAPILGVFSLGFVYFQIGSFSAAGIIMYNNFLCGLFIAIGDMFLGAAVFEISEGISQLNFSKCGLWFLRITRMLLLIGAIVLVFANSSGYNDLAFILVMFLYLCLLFGHPVRLPEILNTICLELGKISIIVFMVHVKTGELVNYCFTNLTETERFVLYYLISLGLAYLLYYVTIMLRRTISLKKLFLQ